MSLSDSKRADSKHVCPGQSLQEYAMIFGLVIILSLGVVALMGQRADVGIQNANGTLFGTPGGNNGAADQLTALLSQPAGSTGSVRFGDPTNTGVLDINDPSSTLTLSITGADGTNTTSVDGIRNALGSVKLAATLEALAAEQTGESKGYFKALADKAYLLGRVESIMESSVSEQGRMNNDGHYNNGNALRDMLALSDDFNRMLQNPPPNMSSQASFLAQQLGGQVYDISQEYKTALSEFVVDGNVRNFELDDCPDYAASCILSEASSKSQDGSAASSRAITQLQSLDAIKLQMNNMLESSQLGEGPLKVTVSDAKALDAAGAVPVAAPSP